MSNIINTGDTLEEGRQKINNIYNNLSLWTAGTGSYSIVPNNGTNNESIGDYSVVGGESSLSNGDYSFIYGQNLTGNVGSFLFGKNNESSADYNFICGEDNSSSTKNNFIGGSGNTTTTNVSPAYNYCFGQNNSIINNLVLLSHVEGKNSSSNTQASNIFGLNNKNFAIYSEIFCSPNSTLSSSADYSFILGGQNINGTQAQTVYFPQLNIKNVNQNSSSSDVLVYNQITKNIEKTQLAGNGSGLQLISGLTRNITLVANASYYINDSSATPPFSLELPITANVGDFVKVISFLDGQKIYPGSNDYIFLGGGFDFTSGTLPNDDTYLVASTQYDSTKYFELNKYETIEFTCINNLSNIEWIISNITTIRNFQKITGASAPYNFVENLGDKFKT